MKNLIRLSILGFAFISMSTYASQIKFVVLKDSTILKGSDIAAITIKDATQKLHSIETVDGDVIPAIDISKIQIYTPKPLNPSIIKDKKPVIPGLGLGGTMVPSPFDPQLLRKISGEGSGG